jgi:hypothetical protein
MNVMSNSPLQKLATIPGMANEVSRAWNQHHFINSVFNKPTLGGILPVNIAEKELEQCSNRILEETARTRAGRPAPRVIPLSFASFAHPAQFAPRSTVIRSGSVSQPQYVGTTLKDLVALSEAEVNALTRKDTEPYLQHHGLGLHQDLSTRKRRLVKFRRMQKDKQNYI